MQMVVIGMHRSGTSAVARCLNLLGAYFGPESVSMGANPENPKGFWERRDVRKINDCLLQAADADWDRVGNFSVDQIADQEKERIQRNIASLLLELDAHRPWFIKEPRLSLVFPVWRPLLDAPVCIHVHRHPLESALSLRTRNNFPVPLGIALWEKYVLAGFAATSGLPRIIISQSDLRDSGWETIVAVAAELRRLGVEGLSDPSRSEIEGFIDPHLSHHRAFAENASNHLNSSQRELLSLIESREILQRRPDDLPTLSSSTLDRLNSHDAVSRRLAHLKSRVVKTEPEPRGAKQALPEKKEAPTSNPAASNEISKERDLLREKVIALEKTLEDRSWRFSQVLNHFKKKIANRERKLAKVHETLRKREQQLAERKQWTVVARKAIGKRDSEIIQLSRRIEALEAALELGSRDSAALPEEPPAKGTARAVTESIPAASAAGSPTIDQASERTANPMLPAKETSEVKVSVVVCVHDALEDLRRCLTSIARHRTAYLNTLILVNDGSAEETVDYMRAFAAESGFRCQLIDHPGPAGYTRAANCGLRASTGDYVILLNSDTIVTPAWIERLIACGESDPRIGIIGPLSNAASWQSIPERFEATGDWAVNEVSPSWVSRLACAFTLLHVPAYPKVPIVNGFCFALKRQTITKIGLFDEVLFPSGYGEENDYCLRAARAGIKAAIADDCYVFHAKSRSYSHATRRSLSAQTQAALREKYGQELEVAKRHLRDSEALAGARATFAQLLETRPCLILFLLNFRGAGGGTISVLQEAMGLRKLGAAVQIAIRATDRLYYRERFPKLPDNLFYCFTDVSELVAYGGSFEFVVATFFTGVRLLKQLVESYPSVIPCYYIQDYEPSFFHRGDSEFTEAFESYTLIPTLRRFAKTRWLCDTVEREQGVQVAKVAPSIDHDIFFADDTVKPGSPFVVCAMVRPMTERRSPGLTLEILDRIKREQGSAVETRVFGVEPDDPYLLRAKFQHQVLGNLSREAVADLMRSASLFIDASTYQAFGRTGLEAMACRCATILPRGGGIYEYAVDGVNSLLAEPGNAGDFMAKIRQYLQDKELYQNVLGQGLEKAARFGIEKACLSELEFFLSLREGGVSAEITSPRGAAARHVAS